MEWFCPQQDQVSFHARLDLSHFMLEAKELCWAL